MNDVVADAEAPLQLCDESVESSSPFVGQWRELVSTTNWDKGRIICEWRVALERGEAPVTDYSDQAWAQLVGGVTSQHVGRLRRVHQRFGGVAAEYQGLYWSHFQSTLDWEDAEMWLEGAVQNGWSVAQMRAKRWEATGAPDASRPPEGAVLQAEVSGEDYDAFRQSDIRPAGDESRAASDAERSVGGESPRSSRGDGHGDDDRDSDVDSPVAERTDAADRVRPFEHLEELPHDVADAFEQFKLAILNHKLAGWAEVKRADVLASLDALKALANAPSDD